MNRLSPASPASVLLVALALVVAPLAAQRQAKPRADVKRTSAGKPDLSGTYNAATLTPLQRPAALADREFLTKEEVEQMKAAERALQEAGSRKVEGERTAPAKGGATVVGFEDRRLEAEALGAGNVGGYNVFWMDRGDDVFSIDGKYRTSILSDPPNGRQPKMHPEAAAALMKYISGFMKNDGTAWWMKEEGPGPYDDIEDRPPEERCLLGFVGGPPTIPALYNNFVRVVQTPTHVMLLNEMIHDARIVRLDQTHGDEGFEHWLGESVGRWDGDTLIIETIHFRDNTGLVGASRNLKVTERLTPLDGDHLHYEFTVDDPTVWTKTWSGDYVWPRSDDKMYEYACHEGNHAMGGIMRGARLLESEAE